MQLYRGKEYRVSYIAERSMGNEILYVNTKTTTTTKI